MNEDFTSGTRMLHSIQFTLDFCHMSPNKGDLRGRALMLVQLHKPVAKDRSALCQFECSIHTI